MKETRCEEKHIGTSRLMNRVNVSAAVLALLFASSYAGITAFDASGERVYSAWSIIVHTLLLFPLLYFAIRFIDWLTEAFSANKNTQWRGFSSRLGRIVNAITPLWSKRSMFLTSAIIAVVFIVWLAMCYPATVSANNTWQIQQFLELFNLNNPAHAIIVDPNYSFVEDVRLNDHNPAFTAILYGSSAAISKAAVGSWGLGIFIYKLIESVLLATGLAASCCYLEKLDVNARYRFAALVFIIVFPPIGFYSTWLIKDVTFCVFFIPYMLLIAEIARTRGEALKSMKTVGALIVLCVLIALSKKTGIYIVILTGIPLLLGLRAYWKRIGLTLVVPALMMFFILPVLVFPAASIVPGGKQEMLGPMLQQTARYFESFPDEITQREQAAVDAVIDTTIFEDAYRYQSSDPIKMHFNRESTTSELFGYLGVWIEQGVKHPLTYLSATIGTAGEFITPTGTLWASTETVFSNYMYIDYDFAQKYPYDKVSDHILVLFSDQISWLSKTPLVSILFTMALYATIIPLMATRRLWLTKSNMLFAITPLLVSLLLCLVSPVPDPRYNLQAIFMAPFVVGLMLSKEGGGRKESFAL